ncbi:hypothetical protein B0T16DRAFT_460660 [Cercophora newfieldiana]|uniref:AMP-binding enzyme C-terminal domain-containing protein n=1 Tax=Cercophora newfieldiana TaxID=92897 RepID=A0AA39Y255_9PEZI|nr:hypothetical protein B0T16DRAFT_460660 [Cercophora newfieldiana]
MAVSELEDVRDVTAVPLTLLIQDDWSFRLNYRTDRYDSVQASRLSESFSSILSEMTTPVATTACTQAALPSAEERKLLELGNACSKNTFINTLASSQTLLDVFEAAVRDHSKLLAVEKGDVALTYEELGLAASKLARHLVQQGIRVRWRHARDLLGVAPWSNLVLRPEDGDIFKVLGMVDVAILTPSAVKGLDPKTFPRLSILYFGGEALPQTTVDLWAQGRDVYNFYGPRLLPHGAVGEIVLAGVQVARGYVGMPEETSAKFLPDSISADSHPQEKMYRSGNTGYWTECGELVCLGRRDRLTKVRGFRVSLASVEEALHAIPGVRAAAVVVADGGTMNAWVAPAVDINKLHLELTSSLPAYARPQRIFCLDSLPLTLDE